jgi:hypothetical protein
MLLTGLRTRTRTDTHAHTRARTQAHGARRAAQRDRARTVSDHPGRGAVCGGAARGRLRRARRRVEEAEEFGEEVLALRTQAGRRDDRVSRIVCGM